MEPTPLPALYETLRQRLWSQELQRYESWKPGEAARMEAFVAEAREAVKAAGGDPYNVPPRPLALRLKEARAGLAQLRADLATVRAARSHNRSLGRIAGPAYFATRKRTLARIRDARATIRDIGVAWIRERQSKLAEPNAIRTPLDNVYCCIEGEFLRDGGSAAEFAAAAREFRRAA